LFGLVATLQNVMVISSWQINAGINAAIAWKAPLLG
jgi:hypothetical protein